MTFCDLTAEKGVSFQTHGKGNGNGQTDGQTDLTIEIDIQMRHLNTWVAQGLKDKTCLLKRLMIWISAAVILSFKIGGFVVFRSIFSLKQDDNTTEIKYLNKVCLWEMQIL